MTKALLSKEDHARIEGAIRDAETKSRAQIVVAVVPESDSYAFWRALGTAVLTLVVALGLHAVVPVLSSEWVLVAQVPIAIVCWLICGLRPLLVALAPDVKEIAAVDRQAKLTFLERGIHETTHRTGVLVFISQLERRVEILADSGIHAHVGQDGWTEHVNAIIRAIREGHAADGICETIERIGARSAEIVPSTSADRNELPNAVVDETDRRRD